MMKIGLMDLLVRTILILTGLYFFFIILTYILQVFNECINYISYIPEWDSFVQNDGELIYIVSKTKTDNTASDGSGLLLKNNETDVATLDRNGFTRQSVRRSSKGCLLNY